MSAVEQTGRYATLRHTVLLVDDDAMLLKLAQRRFEEAGFAVELAHGADDALAKARARTPDVIVSDVIMGDLDGFGLCRLVRREPSLSQTPFVLVSANCRLTDDDHELAAALGASALITRSIDCSTEIAAVHASLGSSREEVSRHGDPAAYERHLRTNAHQMATLLERARTAEKRYRTIFDHASDVIAVCTPEGAILEANERWRDVLGVAPSELVGRNLRDFSCGPPCLAAFEALEQHGDEVQTTLPAVPIRNQRTGKVRRVEFSLSVFEFEGARAIMCLGRDVTPQFEDALRVSVAEEKYRALIERIPDTIWISTGDGRLSFVTSNADRVLGYSREALCAMSATELFSQVHPNDRALVERSFRAYVEEGRAFDIEYRHRTGRGEWIWLHNRSTARYERHGVLHLEGMVTDVTEKKRLEESFRQAQKMEAIGQLTGGIAHDFNNILTAILANSQFLIEDLAAQDPRRCDAEEIKHAAERAAALTRQLLAFSRRQVLQPSIVDLNSALSSLERMIRRLIGEDIEFSFAQGEGLGSVRVDVGQIEQVIMNLVVNARDAMPVGGKLTIETTNVDFDDSARAGAEVPGPGRWVLLAVSDTGTGMDAATRARVFEPFFTTKELGKGTGLGLSTCYGIVKQSGGHISVYSEVGQGTVFKVYLPRIEQAPESTRRAAPVSALTGTETILLIEDDHLVGSAVRRMLEPRGYRLLTAHNGAEALEVVSKPGVKIDLVLSDVVMPGSSGPEVVAQLRRSYGPVRALFMSGYTDHAILRSGHLQSNLGFIQKPFTSELLAKKLREVLDEKEPA